MSKTQFIKIKGKVPCSMKDKTFDLQITVSVPCYGNRVQIVARLFLQMEGSHKGIAHRGTYKSECLPVISKSISHVIPVPITCMSPGSL